MQRSEAQLKPIRIAVNLCKLHVAKSSIFTSSFEFELSKVRPLGWFYRPLLPYNGLHTQAATLHAHMHIELKDIRHKHGRERNFVDLNRSASWVRLNALSNSHRQMHVIPTIQRGLTSSYQSSNHSEAWNSNNAARSGAQSDSEETCAIAPSGCLVFEDAQRQPS